MDAMKTRNKNCIGLERVPSRSGQRLLPSWATENFAQPSETTTTPCSTTPNAPPSASEPVPIATTTETRPDYPRDLLAYARRIGIKFRLEAGVLSWRDDSGETEPCEGLAEAIDEHRDALAVLILGAANAENRHPSVAYGPDSILAD